jgi:uncharacterized protein YecE (DUF72 family)
MLYGGTSGYSFREWVGRFYPPKTASNNFLAYYASRLNSVEINHTFRRFPTAKLTSAWAEGTPESFRFSIKMHRSVTHRARLEDVGKSVADFLAALIPLGPRLGVVLFQLPPYLPADRERLESFLAGLPSGFRFALEFRHPSWNDRTVHRLLGNSGVALCAAEAETGVADFIQTASFGYMRLRRVPPYTDEEFEIVQRQIEKILKQVEDLYLYVKHDDEGIAPETVRRLQSETCQ